MTASLLIPPVARFFKDDGSGEPLSFGWVYTYAAGTLTPKDSYTTYTGNIANTNPVHLDANGEADSCLNRNYKINVEDENHVQLENYPVDNVSSFSTGSIAEYSPTTGSANNYILTPSPAIIEYTAGQAFNILANADNTGPTTINISGIGTQELVVNGNYPLTGGELLEGHVYRIVYDGTNFQVLNPTPPILISQGYSATAPWGTLLMNGTKTIAFSSGATNTGSIYSRVYSYLWSNVSDTYAPVATGRGASAAADFAANKAITIPDWADYVAVGISGAGLVTSAGATTGTSTVTPTGSIAIDSITLLEANLPSSVDISLNGIFVGWDTNPGPVNGATGVHIGGQEDILTNVSTTSNYTMGLGSGTAFTPTGTFSGAASSVVQKSRGLYFYISY